MKRRYMASSGMIGAVFAPIILAVSVCAPAASAKEVGGVVGQTVALPELTLVAGNLPTAPDGKLLTLTVNGVERAIAPGRYSGDVVLTVTDDIPVKYHELPLHHFRTALYVENGAPVAAKSVSAAVRAASFGAGTVSDARIASEGDRFNGIIVTGEGKYTIDHPVIDFIGNGGNDFAGFGAAVMSTGKAEVTLNRPIIRTRGAIRTALFAGGDSVMHINNAEIETYNGTLPADYQFTVDVGKMMEVPWMLGLSGNVRSSNLVDRATMFINNSHIRSEGWGVLSTDDNQRVRMTVTDSLVEAVKSGYGTYSIGDSHNIFRRSVIRAADVGAIMAAEGSITLTDRTLVEAGRYGVMMHSGVGGGVLTIDKGSELHAGLVAIEVKGIGTTIVVDSAKVTAAGGTILQGMENDDPFLKAMMSGNAPAGASAPPPGMGPTGGRPDEKPKDPNIIGTFRNTKLVGNFWNGRPKQGGMVLRFENAEVIGTISTSSVAPASGKDPVKETFQEIGHVTNTAIPVKGEKGGLTVSLDKSSRWVVTGTSYLNSLETEPGARIEAATGTLGITLNGRPVALKPGKIKGAIVVTTR
ncbi:hypothetical protein ACQKO5_17720 [Novosphingobium subterraneum]|uniref:hypothetical protein n=1 Tax=Novosphingobium subterraneum TaxID=48936 RepID=UPI003CFD2EB5